MSKGVGEWDGSKEYINERFKTVGISSINRSQFRLPEWRIRRDTADDKNNWGHGGAHKLKGQEESETADHLQ